jgi:subtilisin family serine protease
MTLRIKIEVHTRAHTLTGSFMRRIILFLVLATVGSVQAAKFKHDSLIVKFAKGTNVKSFARSMGVQGSELLHEDLNIHLLKLDNVVNFESTLSSLKNNPEIIYVQKNHILTRRGTPSDPEYHKLWSLMTQQNGSDARLPKAWDISTGGKDKLGNDIVVAVIDGGVDFNHEDLEDNAWVNTGEIPGNNKDDDGNGYVDDINGWNAAEDNGQVDIDRHGTHVAGIVGAKGNNDLGVVGIGM